MVEGARLERVYGVTAIVGSNPTLSAIPISFLKNYSSADKDTTRFWSENRCTMASKRRPQAGGVEDRRHKRIGSDKRGNHRERGSFAWGLAIR